MNNKLTSNWSHKTLSEVCQIQTGKYDANHAKRDGKYRFYTCAFDYLLCNTNRFSGECLILPGNGVNVGEVFYYNGEFDAYQRTYVLNSINISPKFLYYHLLGNWKHRNQDKQFGSATNYIRMGNFTEYIVPVPPLIIQEQIVVKLEELFSEIDKGIEDLKLAQQQLKIYRQSVLKWAFEGKLTNKYVKDGELPEGWMKIRLGTVIEQPKYGTSKKCDYNFTGVGVLRIPNIARGFVDGSDLKFASFDPKEVETYRLSEGDLLTIRSNGSVDLVGKCALITKKEENFLFAGYLIRLRPLKDKICPKYLLNMLSTIDLRNQIERKAKSTSGVNNINSEELTSLVITIAPFSQQISVVEELDSRLSVADKLEEIIMASLQRAESLKQSILKKAFSGELI